MNHLKPYIMEPKASAIDHRPLKTLSRILAQPSLANTETHDHGCVRSGRSCGLLTSLLPFLAMKNSMPALMLMGATTCCRNNLTLTLPALPCKHQKPQFMALPTRRDWPVTLLVYHKQGIPLSTSATATCLSEIGGRQVTDGRGEMMLTEAIAWSCMTPRSAPVTMTSRGIRGLGDRFALKGDGLSAETKYH